ncbi:MAG TPA: glycoside hydrolase family 3 N-terminal domain-containing protein [Mycobacteriales bacterium]|nr:glycoside hydrolase family 3 N-terminal domain-containing protein [Mycobacteriales bacterium]
MRTHSVGLAVAVLAAILPAHRADAAVAVPAVRAAPVAVGSLEQRVGQLLMVGVPATGADAATLQAISRYHLGGVILTGRSSAGVAATARLTAELQRRAATRLLVAADQEGGAVQVLGGPGFARIPDARVQAGQTPAALRRQARVWGEQLRAAGVRVDLAPVADTVPAGAGNPPIGAFDRQYGADPAAVARHSIAFADGLQDAGVLATVKHFPGLGRVTANPDTTAGVTDRVTTRTDPYLRPFRDAVRAGVPVVMMSTAIYARIDPGRPAAFSPIIIGGLLRHDLGFEGVVVSDDLGTARQVAGIPAGERAVRFVAAGGDLVLIVDPATLPAMYAALLTRARSDPAFRARVEESAGRIRAARQRLEPRPPAPRVRYEFRG